MAATSKSNDWPSSGDDGWGGFDTKPAPKSQTKSAAQTNIDDDGFLLGDGFDPFSSAGGGNPFKSSAGDLEGPPRKNNMSSSSSTGPRKVRPKKPEEKSQSGKSGTGNVVRKTRPAGTSSGAGASSSDKPRRSRRASVV
jgi:hypothetical protein